MFRLNAITLKKSYMFTLVGCAIIIYIYLKNVSLSPKMGVINAPDNDDIADTERSISQIDMQTILSLKKQIRKINKKQIVQNIEHFGYEIALIIVIQVHDKIYYLEQLITSLEQAKGITKTLLIFSHSYCDKEINTLVRNMTFAKVMQVFYPYSVQLHPHVFPGNDNKICSDGLNCFEGNRKPLLMQRKHHWWWKAALVFDKLHITRNYNGSVLFLEEDQYVTSDFIYILKVLERLVNTSYPHCDIISLGNDDLNITGYQEQDATISLKPWTPRDNLGVVFKRNVWDTMRKLSEYYCRYNDVRWINSLIHLSTKSALGNFYVLSVDSPRILRFNDCVNNNGTNCNMVERVEHVQSFVEQIQKGLYPHNLIVKETNAAIKLDPNRGWSDARDQELCLLYTNKKDLA